MTEAKVELIERVVSGPKGIIGKDKNGARKLYAVGETMWLTPQQARSKARYLCSPAVATAQALVDAEKAELDAIVEAEVIPGPTPTDVPEPTAEELLNTGKPPLPLPELKPDLIEESGAE